MTNQQIQRVALWLQVGGFLPVLATILIWHPWWAIFLVIAFGIHLAGDVLFFLANRTEQKGETQMPFDIKQYVKLPAFLQFVAYQLIVGILLFVVHRQTGFWAETARVAGFVALAVGIGAFLYRVHLTLGTLSTVPAKLQLAGGVLIVIGLFLLIPHLVAGAIVAYLGLGMSMAGFVYDLIYV